MVEGKDSLQISAAWETEEWVTSFKKNDAPGFWLDLKVLCVFLYIQCYSQKASHKTYFKSSIVYIPAY